MRGRVAILILSVCALFFACQQKKEPIVEPSIMYEASELAQLMRDMHDTLSVWKVDLAEGDSVFIYPKYFEQIHSAKATTPEALNDAFYIMASSFEHAVYDFKTNKDIESYNLIIQSCVTCHQSHCQGPIPKIEKLLIQ